MLYSRNTGATRSSDLYLFFPDHVVYIYYFSVKTMLSTGLLSPNPIQADGLFELVFAMLCMETLRTVEKPQARAR